MNNIQTCAVPALSALAPSIASASFHDSYVVSLPRDGRTALQLYLAMASSTPAWVDGLMRTRNRVVSRVGLKDLGTLGEFDPKQPLASYTPGQRVGIFTLHALRDEEVILGDSDRHLDVKISVLRRDDPQQAECTQVCVSTVVHVRNTLGRAYMAVVAPVHRKIVPAMMKRLLITA